FNRTLTQNFSIGLGNVDLSKPASFRSMVAARAFVPSSFSVSVNGGNIITHNLSSVEPNFERPYASDSYGSSTLNLSSANLNITYSYNQPNPGSMGWLDFFEINTRNFLSLNGAQL